MSDDGPAGAYARGALTGKAIRKIIDTAGLSPDARIAVARAVQYIMTLHAGLVAGAPAAGEAEAVDRAWLAILAVLAEDGSRRSAPAAGGAGPSSQA